MSKPAPSALTLPRLPPGMMTTSGTSQSNCCTISIDDRLLPFEAQRVHRVGQVDAALGGQALHDRHAAVEVGVERQHERAVGDRLHQLRRGHLAARQEHDGANARGGAVGGERRRGVAGRGAGDRAHRLAVGDHLPHRRDQHGHAEILEAAGVRVAALLDPQILKAELAAEALGPEEVGAALVHRHDLLVAHRRGDPLLLAPDGRAVGPRRALVAIVEQLHPGGGRARLERVHVVRDLEQIAARRAAIERLVERVGAGAAGDAAERGAKAHAAVIASVTSP